MKRIFCCLGAITVLFFGACGDSNKRLSQESAEKAIKSVAVTHNVPSKFGMRDTELCFNVESIYSIELSQFSDNEAIALVRFKCPSNTTSTVFSLQFVFQKDIDKRWFLTKLAYPASSCVACGQVDAMVQDNQNLKVLAQ